MNMKEIKEMLQLMADHNLTELEIDKDGLKVKFKKGNSPGQMVLESGTAAPQVYIQPASANREAGSANFPAPTASPGATEALPADVLLVKSPMVGTFYAAPAPDQPPYASPGSKVKEGDVLCIVEAMKLMNEIKSEVSGEILEVLAKNGQPIEFDQPLFKVKKLQL